MRSERGVGPLAKLTRQDVLEAWGSYALVRDENGRIIGEVRRADRIEAELTTWAEWVQASIAGGDGNPPCPVAEETPVWIVLVTGEVISDGEPYSWQAYMFDARNGLLLCRQVGHSDRNSRFDLLSERRVAEM